MTAFSTDCSICVQFQDSEEIENPQTMAEDESSQNFTSPVGLLMPPNDYLKKFYLYKSQYPMKCPECGAYYQYRRFAPGGSEDVMRTYIHEKIRRISFLEAHKALQTALYDAFMEVKNYGDRYQQQYEEVQKGVEEEENHLRHFSYEIITRAVKEVRNKHEYSEKTVRPLIGPSPKHIVGKIISETREREEKVAVYNMDVIIKFLPDLMPDNQFKNALPAVIKLINDDNPEIRKKLIEIIQLILSDENGKLQKARMLAALKRSLLKLPELNEAIALCEN